jgi:hypothetical protein
VAVGIACLRLNLDTANAASVPAAESGLLARNV